MQWSNTLCNKQGYIRFSLDQTDSSYTVYMQASQETTLQPYDLGLLIEIDSVPVSVWMSAWPLVNQIKHYLSGKPLESLPVQLRAELLETAWRPLLSAITLQTNTRIRVLNFLKLKPSFVNPFSLSISLQDNSTGHKSNMILLMHDRLLPVMQRILSHWPNHFNCSFWLEQKTPLWLQRGTLELSMAELKALDLADILLIETLETEQQVILRLGLTHYYHASLEADQLTIESGIQTMTQEYLNDEDEISELDDVPVRLTFDLGELVLPFRDIQALTQGYVIDLKAPLNRAVTIRSMNKVIGAGELVDIDGRLGVRIVKLLGNQHKQAREVATDMDESDG